MARRFVKGAGRQGNGRGRGEAQPNVRPDVQPNNLDNAQLIALVNQAVSQALPQLVAQVVQAMQQQQQPEISDQGNLGNGDPQVNEEEVNADGIDQPVVPTYIWLERFPKQKPHSFSSAMFTSVVCAVNGQIALALSHFTWTQHILIWGSIVLWFIFLTIYGSLPPEYSHSAFQIFMETLAPSPMFWATTILVVVACNFPYFVHISFQRTFHPTDHHSIQEIRYYKKDVEDRHMWRRERRKARQATNIGFTARVDAKIRNIKRRLHKKTSIMVGGISNEVP